MELGEDTDGLRRELLKGEVVVNPAADFEHAHVVAELAFQLLKPVKANKLGLVLCDVDTKIGDHDVPRPDVLYLSKLREKGIDRKKSQTVPDLAVEMLSPGNAKTDLDYKFSLYARGEIPCYWIVDPEQQTFRAYQLINNEYQLFAEGSEQQVVKAPPFLELAVELGELWWRGSE